MGSSTLTGAPWYEYFQWIECISIGMVNKTIDVVVRVETRCDIKFEKYSWKIRTKQSKWNQLNTWLLVVKSILFGLYTLPFLFRSWKSLVFSLPPSVVLHAHPLVRLSCMSCVVVYCFSVPHGCNVCVFYMSMEYLNSFSCAVDVWNSWS